MQEKKRTSGSLRPKAMGRLKKDLEGPFYSRRDSSTTTSEHGREFRFQFFFGFLETTGHSFFDTRLLAGEEIYFLFSNLTRLGMLTMVLVEKAYSKEN